MCMESTARGKLLWRDLPATLWHNRLPVHSVSGKLASWVLPDSLRQQVYRPDSVSEMFFDKLEIEAMDELYESPDLMEHLDQVIKKNFMQLNFYIEERSMLVMTESPASTIPTIFANLGGILNLWAGITFYTFIELVELVYYLLRNGGSGITRGSKLNTQPEDTGTFQQQQQQNQTQCAVMPM